MKISSKKSLEDHLPSKGEFRTLRTQYETLKAAMDAQIHPLVTTYANLATGSFFNDHGVQHIADVVKSAQRLLEGANGEISEYELFILLVAINYHDVGNMFGRIKHEDRINEVLEKFFSAASFDYLDRTLATQVASKHGGDSNGNRDRLSELERHTTWKNSPVRPQLLASLLKLADELSEHNGRGDKRALDMNLLQGNESEIHHAFACSVNNLMPDLKSGSVDYRFYLTVGLLQNEYVWKAGGKIRILEYIYQRVLKTYLECIYCSKYARGFFFFDRVNVRIEIYDNQKPIKLTEIAVRIEGGSEYPGDGDVSKFSSLLSVEGRTTPPTSFEILDELGVKANV